MKILLLLCFIVLTLSKVVYLTQLKPESCSECSFQSSTNSRSSEIHQGTIIIPGVEKSTNSHNGKASVLFVYQKQNGTNFQFQKKIFMPKINEKFIDGEMYTSLSNGNLLVGFVGNIEGGNKEKQQALIFSKANHWEVSKSLPIVWTQEDRPREGSLRSDVRIIGLCGDYAIVGALYFHNYGIWVNNPMGFKLDGTRFGVMNHFSRPIGTGFNGNKPNFLLTISSHSYVMFEPEGSRFQNSLYGSNNGNFENCKFF
jgi:hypothetical protein